jgi:hypothetical protein
MKQDSCKLSVEDDLTLTDQAYCCAKSQAMSVSIKAILIIFGEVDTGLCAPHISQPNWQK